MKTLSFFVGGTIGVDAGSAAIGGLLFSTFPVVGTAAGLIFGLGFAAYTINDPGWTGRIGKCIAGYGDKNYYNIFGNCGRKK